MAKKYSHPKVCKVCEKEYFVRKDKIVTSQFCSMYCKDEYKVKNQERCIHCGDFFLKQVGTPKFRQSFCQGYCYKDWAKLQSVSA
jgi:hypothetical protein